MNTYDHFRLSLQAEFKCKAHTQIRVLWADLEELGEALDEPARTVALQQFRRRVLALEFAAQAVDAQEVRAVSKVILRTLGSRVPQADLFARLEPTMTKLAEALYSTEAETPAFERSDQPIHAALVGSLPD